MKLFLLSRKLYSASRVSKVYRVREVESGTRVRKLLHPHTIQYYSHICRFCKNLNKPTTFFIIGFFYLAGCFNFVTIISILSVLYISKRIIWFFKVLNVKCAKAEHFTFNDYTIVYKHFSSPREVSWFVSGELHSVIFQCRRQRQITGSETLTNHDILQ